MRKTFCIFIDEIKTNVRMNTKDKNKTKSDVYFRQDKNVWYSETLASIWQL